MLGGFIPKTLQKKSGHILLVEDNQVIASTESRILKKLGYSVTLVSSGERALSEIISSAGDIDLVLMDIDLGEGMDGTAAAKEILKVTDVPVLFLSGVEDPDTLEKTDDVLSYGYVVKGSGMAILDASIRMAFRLHRANMELKMKERDLLLLSNAIEASGDAVAISAPDAVLIYANRAFLKLWGYSDKSEVIGRPAVDFWEEHERVSFVAQSISKGGWSGDLVALSSDGSHFNVDVTTSLVPGSDNTPVGIVASFRDNTARKLADQSVLESEERYRDIFENALEGIYQTTPDGRYLNINPAFARMFGYDSSEEMIIAVTDIGKQVYVDTDIRERMSSILMEKGSVENFEAEVYRKNGSRFWISINAHVVRDRDGKVHHFEGTNIDITDRKNSEIIMEKSVREKDTLLREIQHRIKNNLNVISGLLYLESEQVEDEKAKRVFVDVRARINSMSSIYEKLYRSSDIENIDLSLYIRSLADSILDTYSIDRGKFDLVISAADVMLDLKRSVPFGLVLNELITNSLKHAYPGGAGGEIYVSLDEEAGVITLKVSDIGRGLPENYDPFTGSTMGLNLVKMIVEQMNGSVEISSGNGTMVVIKFRR